MEVAMRSRLVPLFAAAAIAASIGPAAAYQGYVAAPVDVHAGPGLRFAVVATVPAGAPLDVGLCGPAWCQVQFMGGNGFIAAPLLIAGLPPVAPAAVAAGGPFDLLTAPFSAIGSVFGAATDTPAPAVAPAPPVMAAY
jgi:hypothetical protein